MKIRKLTMHRGEKHQGLSLIHIYVATTCDTIRSKVKDGAIVLMHDMEASSAQASQIIIPELIAAGYELVTVSEMAAARGGMVPGQVYNYFDPALGQTQAETEIDVYKRQTSFSPSGSISSR